MNNWFFSLAIFLISVLIGVLGSITGLGGGTLIVPILVLFGVDIHYAIGASLVSVIATSSGSAAAYLKQNYINVKLAMFLELATTIGALIGGFLLTRVETPLIQIIFGVFLLASLVFTVLSNKNEVKDDSV